MAADLRYYSRLQDLIDYHARRGDMSELSKLLDQASEAAWVRKTGEQGQEGVEVERIVLKALALYVRHNTEGQCNCNGCADIRGVLVAYLQGFSP